MRNRTKAPDHKGPHRAFCEAAGWCFISNSDKLLRMCGEPFGIVHAAAFEALGDDYTMGVYDTWETCHDDWVAHPETPQPSTAIN